MKVPYSKIASLESVYIYLMKKSYGSWKRVCYYRGHITDFEVKNAPIKWLQMVPDLAIGETKEPNKAGIIGIRLAVHDVGNDGQINWADYPLWQKMKKRADLYKASGFLAIIVGPQVVVRNQIWERLAELQGKEAERS